MLLVLKVLSHGLRVRGPCNVIFLILAASIQNIIKPEVRMQSKNTIAIEHVMAGMLGIYKLYVCYLEHRCWMQVEV